MRRRWAAPAGRVELVGRDAELKRLAAAVSAAKTGQGKILLISGEPGIGKTAILAALVDLAADARARICTGAAEELEMRVPFAAVSDCLGLARAAADEQVAEIAGLLRGPSSSGSGSLPSADREFLITEAILRLVDRWCAVGPVLLTMDDLQWADPASLLVLHRLGRVAGQLPMVLAAARRSGTGGADLEPLVRSWDARGAETLALGPLDEASVVTLTGQVVGTQVDAGVRDAITAAAGNPLYVIELARALADDPARMPGRMVETGGQEGDGAGSDVPKSLMEVVSRRLSGLSSQARQVLPVAAVLGASFTAGELAAVLNTPVLDLLSVIQEAAAAEVLVAEADRLAFRHAVIRQALYESLPASARNALHVQAGQALAAAGAPVERAAQHLLAGTTLDARTLDWLAGSASLLSKRAPDLAADLLSRVCDANEMIGDHAGQLRLELARALLRAGRFGQAEEAAARALAAGPDGDLRGRLRWVLVQSCLNQGHAEAALTEARRALDDGSLSQAERARFHGLTAQVLRVVSTGPETAMREAEAARDASLASEDAYAMAYGLQAVAGAWRWLGRFAEAVDVASEAVAALERAGPIVDSQLDPQLIRANCLVELDRDAEARQAYVDDLRLAERGTGTFFLGFHHLSVARMFFLAGRWDDALAELSTAQDVPDQLALTVHMDGLAALIAVHRQDRSALGRLRDALDHPLVTGPARHTYDDRSWGRALAALADGDHTAAFGLVSGAWERCAIGGREWCGHYLLPDLATLAGSLAEQETARRAVNQLQRYCADRKGPAMHRSAGFAEAILDNDVASLLSIADAFETAGRPLLEAQAREHAAEILATRGHDQDARLQLDAAQDRYARLEASWDAARADSRLRALGIRRGVHGSRRRPKVGWGALTETEQTVANLLAEGLSNPEIASRMFISRRTVQFHVSNILGKLSLSSRVELAALVVRRAG